MPCIEEWLSNPLLLIDQISGVDDEAIVKQVHEYFSERISQEGINKVQSLNDKSLDSIKPNMLVRFRCMIQDMFEPEYFMSRYETIDSINGTKEVNMGLYRDVVSYKPGHQVDMNSRKNLTKERQCFYCVPVPAETSWAKKISYAKTSGPSNCGSGLTSSKTPAGTLKRPHAELQCASDACDMMIEPSNNEAAEISDNKKPRSENNPESTRTVVVGNTDFNFPLPDEKGPACIVKIYDEGETFKVNDIVEFVGILSVDPQLTQFQNQSCPVSSPLDVMEVEEDDPHCLPSSLVPRIHAVVSIKLEHSNPLLALSTDLPQIESQFRDLGKLREALVKGFEDIFYGDSLAAEYFLFHLLSTVYSRPDVLALGKYALNIIGCSKDVARGVYQMVELLVPKCCNFPMTIENLNKSKLVPKKDYKTNRLTSGKLQLSNNTHVVIDETVLEEGQLDNNGVQNISALNHVISWQKLQYDFGFYKTDFLTNVIILVLSESKSVLEADSRVQIVVKRPPVSFEKVLQNYDEAFVNNVRKYIGLAHLINYEISADVQKYIEDDFVKMRQEESNGITVEKFHSLLSLARLMAISYGRKHLLKEDWTRTKHLEESRRNRLASRTNP